MGICFVLIIHIGVQSDVRCKHDFENPITFRFTKQNLGEISPNAVKSTFPCNQFVAPVTTHFIRLSYSFVWKLFIKKCAWLSLNCSRRIGRCMYMLVHKYERSTKSCLKKDPFLTMYLYYYNFCIMHCVICTCMQYLDIQVISKLLLVLWKHFWDL